jgi:hypothetical protein
MFQAMLSYLILVETKPVLSVHTLSLIAQWPLLISLLAYMLCKTKYAKAVLLDTLGSASVRRRLQFHLLLSSSSGSRVLLMMSLPISRLRGWQPGTHECAAARRPISLPRVKWNSTNLAPAPF